VFHGNKKSIKVKVENISQFIAQTNFVCQFNIEGRVTDVPAQLLGDIIQCGDTEFTSKTPNTTATFVVLWNGSKPLDNPENIHVIIYHCSKMADNCGLCHALSEKYQCGWCQTSGK
jgi:plexin A